MNSGWQIADDPPIAYRRLACKIMEPWTDDLLRSGGWRDGEPGPRCSLQTRGRRQSRKLGYRDVVAITAIDLTDAMLGVARLNPQIE